MLSELWNSLQPQKALAESVATLPATAAAPALTAAAGGTAPAAPVQPHKPAAAPPAGAPQPDKAKQDSANQRAAQRAIEMGRSLLAGLKGLFSVPTALADTCQDQAWAFQAAIDAIVKDISYQTAVIAKCEPSSANLPHSYYDVCVAGHVEELAIDQKDLPVQIAKRDKAIKDCRARSGGGVGGSAGGTQGGTGGTGNNGGGGGSAGGAQGGTGGTGNSSGGGGSAGGLQGGGGGTTTPPAPTCPPGRFPITGGTKCSAVLPKVTAAEKQLQDAANFEAANPNAVLAHPTVTAILAFLKKHQKDIPLVYDPTLTGKNLAAYEPGPPPKIGLSKKALNMPAVELAPRIGHEVYHARIPGVAKSFETEEDAVFLQYVIYDEMLRGGAHALPSNNGFEKEYTTVIQAVSHYAPAEALRNLNAAFDNTYSEDPTYKYLKDLTGILPRQQLQLSNDLHSAQQSWELKWIKAHKP